MQSATPYIQFNRLCWVMDHVLRTFSYELLATSHELRTSSYELRSSRYELQETRYELRDTRFELWAKKRAIRSHLRRLMNVRYNTCTVHWMYGAGLHRSMNVRYNICTVHWMKAPAYECMVECCTVHSTAGAGAISKLTLQGHRFWIKWYRPVNFNAIVVKTLKPVFASFLMVSL